MVKKNISIEKHYSSLKPHFTLTILPPSPLLHFAAFCSPLLHMVKVEHCTCPVKHCFLKYRITDRFLVLLKNTESLKSTKRAITRMQTLWSSQWKHFGFFFLKTAIFFHKQIFPIFQTLHLVGTWKLLTATVIRFVVGKNKLYLVDKV